MTRNEFLTGWKLLVLQPAAWRFNQIGKDGRPTADAIAQLDFYFSKLGWADPEAWRKVAELYAEGKEWPSIQELRSSLQNLNRRAVKALPHRSEGTEMPEEVRAMLAKIGQPMVRGGRA